MAGIKSDYAIAWGRALASIRASDAFESSREDVLLKFDAAFKSASAQQEDRIGVALADLENKGWVKKHTVGSQGHQGFWEASRSLISVLDYAFNYLANPSLPGDAAMIGALAQRLQQVKIMDGSTLPPLTRNSQRSQTDLRLWRGKLSQERRTLSVQIEAVLGPGTPAVSAVAPIRVQAKQSDASMQYGQIQPIQQRNVQAGNVQQQPAAEVMVISPILQQPKQTAPPEAFMLSMASCIQLLEIAMANADVDVHGLAEAVITCRSAAAGFDPIGVQKLMTAEQRLSGMLENRLGLALESLDCKNLWVTFLRMYRLLKQCRVLGYDGPSTLKAHDKMAELSLSDDPVLNVFKLPRVDAHALQHFQRLFDVCTCPGAFNLPRLQVERVIEVYHECTRAEYLLRRSELVAKCEAGGPVKQMSVKSQDPSINWNEFLGCSHKPLETKYNEFFAFHGTSPSIAEVITDTDFKINREAVHGYTFGRGVYLSEYVTHAQFFASSVMGGMEDNRCAILVCRCFAGRVQEAGQWPKTAQRHTQADQFEQRLKDGTFHSTMGAEWPDHYEMREFILADDDQVLPEFIVICRMG